MEVHKHPHHVTHKKKWTEYLLEFLMLFLAVFLGFLAENFREHEIEKVRGKGFIHALSNDLRLDMDWLDTVSKSANVRIQNIDSALFYIAQGKDNEIPLTAYQHLQRSMVQVMFFPNDGTLAQLKNSGGMRLINSRRTVDSIEQYDRQMRRLEVRRDITNQLTHDFTEALNKAVSGTDLLNTFYDSAFYRKKVNGNKSIKLSGQNLNELVNACIAVRLRAVSDIAVNEQIKKIAASLIEFLKKEYHLEK